MTRPAAVAVVIAEGIICTRAEKEPDRVEVKEMNKVI
jgi:hypothetical protein